MSKRTASSRGADTAASYPSDAGRAGYVRVAIGAFVRERSRRLTPPGALARKSGTRPTNHTRRFGDALGRLRLRRAVAQRRTARAARARGPPAAGTAERHGSVELHPEFDG